jgi:hypothetical protein
VFWWVVVWCWGRWWLMRGWRFVNVSCWGIALPAALLSFASPKESRQRKGDPWLRGRLCRLLCATQNRRGLRNSGLWPSNSPRPFSASFCVARRSTRGWKGVTVLLVVPTQKIGLFFELTVTDAA